MTPNELDVVFKEVVKMLLEVQRYDMKDIENRYPSTSETDRMQVEITVWRAKEHVLKEHGIDYGPLRGFSGVYERKDWVQIAARSRRRRRVAGRIERRALQRMELAAELAPDGTKETLQKEADRQKLLIAMRRRRPNLPGFED